MLTQASCALLISHLLMTRISQTEFTSSFLPPLPSFVDFKKTTLKGLHNAEGALFPKSNVSKPPHTENDSRALREKGSSAVLWVVLAL